MSRRKEEKRSWYWLVLDGLREVHLMLDRSKNDKSDQTKTLAMGLENWFCKLLQFGCIPIEDIAEVIHEIKDIANYAVNLNQGHLATRLHELAKIIEKDLPVA